MPDYQKTVNPNHAASSFPKDCSSCHTTTVWKGAKFDHSLSRFPLTGAHTNAECALCHVAGKYTGTVQTCEGCHIKAYETSTNPAHTAAAFPKTCSTCHTTTQWKGAQFDHATGTHFPLTGAHTSVTCLSCHVGNKFAGTAATCEGCHLKDYTAAKSPEHAAAGFPKNCTVCHTTTQWKGANFDHAAMTKFPLTGAHSPLACQSCHVGGQFAGTPQACAGCHLKDFQGTTSPNHQAAGFSQECASCHTTTQWKGAQFDHGKTKFPLTGSHTTVACASCHVGGKYTGTPAACSGCHLKDYQGTTNPNHAASGFPTECNVCHTTVQWKGAEFDHAQTKFPLTGAHTTAQCASCHVGGKFTGTVATCEGCHLPDYQKASNPNHVSAGFTTNCSVCHTTTQWKGAQFDHTKTKFALTGAHVATACQSCHIGNRYAGTPSTCEGCHTPDFQKTTSPNHTAAGFPKDCTVCHTTTQWKGAKFDHSTMTKFALTGKHAQAQCSSCHINNLFKGTPQTCDGCHLPDYQKTSNPNHASAGFSTSCSVCHTTTQWKGAQFDHSKTKFALTGAHVATACQSCHIGNKFVGTPSTCEGCHTPDFQKTTSPNHTAAGFPKDCTVCHTTTQWKGAKFDHSTMTKFALTGKHAQAQCSSCHVNNLFKGTPQTCDGCHLPDYQKTTNPNHTAAGFPKDCTVCHTTTQWKGAKFDHSTMTKFALTGKHAQAQCSSCHVNNLFKGTPQTCDGCHLPDYQKTTNPNHVSAGFSTSCSTCHTTIQWKGAVFDHSKTKFALTGAHVATPCQSCHIGSKYAGTASTCEGCHTPDYQKTTNPNHVTAGFPKDCTVCHTTTQWKGAIFDHSKTKFALTGAHVATSCQSCHIGNKYTGTISTCEGCHTPDYQKTSNPNHVAAGFPKDCAVCHTTTQWKGAKFDHTAMTKFPLTGAHVHTQCSLCHVNGLYKGTPQTCDGCHLPDYQKTVNPNHVSAGFPKDCTACHNTTQWKGAKFDHTAMTKFPLTGAHVQTQCSLCHVNGVYKGTPQTCDGCHLPDYQKTTTPNHATAGFPKDCTVCHNTTQWKGAKFDHTAMTKFPLTGAHIQAPCLSCHVNNVFKGTPQTCQSCHLALYKATTNPNHAAAGFPTDCTACHNTTQWKGAVFNHGATRFALTGKHATTQCSLCHVNGVYAGTPMNCDACHLPLYNSTTNPNHVTAGFPKDCSVCHSTTQWKGAVFNHALTKFPLTGAHTTVACASCHVGGRYTGTPTDCYACHQKVYEQVSNPNHLTAGFPHTCASCHTTTQWKGAKFNHNFPIYTGKHAGKWTTCNDCHTTPSNYAVFSCIDCHAHNKTDMDKKHNGRKNYVYASPSCYQCHPKGSE
jgi:hypothetical protein